jgi:ABC-2 type transport system ATP-binding protein
MSLQIRHLSKTYGAQYAVRDISFSVGEGDIVGFLGPNGAGKSTTMKIATGYLPPTSGEVIVGGYNVAEDPLSVKEIIGYLPEQNPLYLDMYVIEYLGFVGRLFKLKNLKRRVTEIIDQCGLAPEQGKKIEALSKGYRQRVGLAQALIHNPKVLILDEPTSGLDPNQLLEIRKLIKEISVEKTVLFSTHIMQEVQALCDRVIVINKGEIVADDKLQTLMAQKDQNASVVIELEQPIPLEDLRAIDGVKEVFEAGPATYRVVPQPGKDVRSELFRFASDKKIALVGLKLEENSLENIFKTLTLSSPEE